MVGPSKCWTRCYTSHSDYGYGLFASRDISRGETVLIEFPERVIHPNGLDGQQDLPEDVVFGDKFSSLDDPYASKQKLLLGKKPTLLYVTSPQPLESSGDTEGTPKDGGENSILILPSAVNHSCAPNMLRVDSVNLQTGQLECRFVATRNISGADQLTIHYDPRLSKWENPQIRRALLLGEYGFFCRCRKCVSQSGWRDLMPLAPVSEERMRDIVGNYSDSRTSMLPLHPKESIDLGETTISGEEHINSESVPLDGTNSLIGTKAPRKQKMNLWIGAVSHRTKTWLKNFPGEVKESLGMNKISIEDPDPSVAIEALHDNRKEDGTLLSKVFRLENVKTKK